MPFSVEVVAGEGNRSGFGVADLHPGWVGVRVKDGLDLEAGVGGGRGDGLENDGSTKDCGCVDVC